MNKQIILWYLSFASIKVFFKKKSSRASFACPWSEDLTPPGVACPTHLQSSTPTTPTTSAPCPPRSSCSLCSHHSGFSQFLTPALLSGAFAYGFLHLACCLPSPFLLADSHFSFSFPPRVAYSRSPVGALVTLDLDHNAPSSLPSSCGRVSSLLKLLTWQSLRVPWKQEFVLIIVPFPQSNP